MQSTHQLCRLTRTSSLSFAPITKPYARRSSSSSAIASRDALPNENQTFTLSCGRRLGFAEYGSSTGRPLLYFHGYPASRREPQSLHLDLLKRDIRLLSVERPGIGLSTYQPDRQLADWADDVSEFARGMKLEKFGVFGVSGGGPYAIACARGIPQTALTAAGVFAGAPSWSLGAHHMTRSRRWLAYLADRWPRLLKLLMAPCVRLVQSLVNRASFQRRLDAWLEAVMRRASENSGTAFAEKTPEEMARIREGTFGPMFDHFAQGTDGFVKETQVLVRPWGFPFGDVKGKVWMYHGVKDENTPIALARTLASELGDCELREFEKDDHYTMGNYMSDAMEKVVGGEKDRRV